MYQLPYHNNEYRQQEVMGASPVRLVIMAYDLAIRSCEQQDFVRATKAISVLRDALNFDYPEISVGLFRLYQYCLECLRQGEWDGAASVLRDLREAWVRTDKKTTRVAVQPGVPSYAGSYVGMEQAG